MYKLAKGENNFKVIEVETEQVIREYPNHDKAHTLYRKLKGGAGFQGNTPPFFLKDFIK